MKRVCVAAIMMLIVAGFIVAGGTQEAGPVAVAGPVETGSEAPMLAERVARGELPPLEQRLPNEPFVVEPLHEIGSYGGTVRVAHTRVHLWWHEVWNMGLSRLLQTGPEGNVIPHVAAGWDFSPDAQTFTLYLREGLKWSDGHPFTADDILFWYEDVLLNETLTPSISATWRPGGEVVRIEKIDDLTVRYQFATANPHFVTALATNTGDVVGAYLPKHYLQRFHPTYVAEADLSALTAEQGFEQWWQLFQDYAGKLTTQHGQRPVDAPTLSPYVVVRREGNVTNLERNPYFWKVDTAGNQLPYIDSVRAELVGNVEVQEAKVIAGELDLYVGVAGNLGLYTRHAESAGIKPYLWTTGHAARTSIHPNMAHRDPVLRELFQDDRFRKAMSLALNREEISELVWLGLAEPRQATVVPPSPFYREEFARAYADYDPDQASRLLDEIGLRWDANREYRLRPDGERLRFTIQAHPAHRDWVQTTELAVEYWREIGLEAVLQTPTSPLFEERIAANEHDVVVWGTEWTEINHALDVGNNRYVPRAGSYGMVPWGQWYQTNGRDGEEPPQWAKDIQDLVEIWYYSGDERARFDAGMALVRSQAENIWYIGTAGMPVRPMILSSRLRNVPEANVYTLPTGNAQMANPETWYYRD